MREVIIGHPLDDDGFVDSAINELTKITNKWNLVVEADERGVLYLVYRCSNLGIEERYVFEYNHKSKKYE